MIFLHLEILFNGTSTNPNKVYKFTIIVILLNQYMKYTNVITNFNIYFYLHMLQSNVVTINSSLSERPRKDWCSESV